MDSNEKLTLFQAVENWLDRERDQLPLSLPVGIGFGIAIWQSGGTSIWIGVLGSGLIDHNQKMTVAAMQMADMKVCAHRS